MPEAIDEILSEVKQLKSWLYGQNGHEGDIPEIKQSIKEIRGCVSSHEKSIILLEERTKPFSNKQKAGITGGTITGLVTFIYLLGKKIGWW